MQVRAITAVRARRVRRALAAGVVAALAMGAAACSAKESGSTLTGWRDIGVALIPEDSADPFFVAMREGAEDDAARIGVKLTVAADLEAGDAAGQVAAVEAAVSRGDKGILVIPTSPDVNAALKKARDAGLYVIALGSPPDPADSVDITFATDEGAAGRLVGRWVVAQLGGKPANLAIVEPAAAGVGPAPDVEGARATADRERGFLEGLGIAGAADPAGPPAAGTYTGGAGGPYAIRCHVPTPDPTAASPAPTPSGTTSGSPTASPSASPTVTPSPSPISAATASCLATASDVTVVFAGDQAAATAASAALAAAGTTGALVVSVDGSCAAVAAVEEGVIGAIAQADPRTMASLGMEAIAKVARGGEKPETTEGLDVLDTGSALVTDAPVGGVESIGTTAAERTCWG